MTNNRDIRIILLILDFKIGNGRQSKDYLTTWGEIFFSFTYFFFIKTRIRDFLLDIHSAYRSFVWTAAIWLEISGCNNIVSILLLYFYYNLLIFGIFDNHRILVRHVYIILIYNRDMYSSSWFIDDKLSINKILHDLISIKDQ